MWKSLSFLHTRDLRYFLCVEKVCLHTKSTDKGKIINMTATYHCDKLAMLLGQARFKIVSLRVFLASR